MPRATQSGSTLVMARLTFSSSPSKEKMTGSAWMAHLPMRSVFIAPITPPLLKTLRRAFSPFDGVDTLSILFYQHFITE
jgi:hypothetical protein